MLKRFTKMQGCGNDYIYIDCMEKEIKNPNNEAKRLSKKRYGIGSDGLILICSSKVADAKMRMFNSDGSEGKMCGNGIRCVGKFLRDNKYIKGNQIKIETLSGIKTLKFVKCDKETVIDVDMGSVEFNSQNIPMKLNEKKVISYPVNYKDINLKITCMSIGNPHAVIFVDDLDNIDLEGIGEYLNKSDLFPEGVNVEFVKVSDEKNITMRVYERGSKETLACGTGACAAAIGAIENGYCKKGEEINVKLKGGKLKVVYTDKTVHLIGEAVTVFEGKVKIEE